MYRKAILVAAIATIFSSSVVAQELSRLELNRNQFDTRNQTARVNSLPSGYFADQSSEGVIEQAEAQGSTQLQNLLVISGFGALLLMGGVITGCYVMKRRSDTHQRKAPPIKLCV